MFCVKCGAKISDGAAFCQKCGAKIVSADSGRQPSSEPVPTSAGSVPAPTPKSIAIPQIQADPIAPDHRQRGIIGLCKAMFALRVVDAVGWTLVVIIQIWGGVGFWQIVWNVIGTILCYVLAVRLFGVISNSFNSVRVLQAIEYNLDLAVIGGIFYGWQFFSKGILIVFPFIGLEIAILVVGAIAYFPARRIRKETMPDKDMTVGFQQGEKGKEDAKTLSKAYLMLKNNVQIGPNITKLYNYFDSSIQFNSYDFRYIVTVTLPKLRTRSIAD